ncbi:hypothetical protein PMZ80_006369 [Knufia obscura]|uniref:Uncharacterized protein n=1 Tax=Knufia obscura TaxID=1635080 RepID=A0ABR0RL87_9EURO|nr:hypothetical protein PMZ80_006369 [Knufia obscura]
MASDPVESIGSAIGVIGDVVGLISSIVNTLFPPAPPESLNNFRVHVGSVNRDNQDENGNKIIDTEEEKSLSGNAPALAAWGPGGTFLGQVTPDGVTTQKINAPGFRDYSIEGRSGAEYLSVVQTGNDGVCIHLITAQSANVNLKYAWTGDIGKACGAPWYPSAQRITNVLEETPPVCVWIDGNGDSGHIWKGFNFHLPSFPVTEGADDKVQESTQRVVDAWKANRDLLCKSEPRFSMYEDIKIGNQIRTYLGDPTFEDASSQEYADKVLNADNWDWGEKPPAGKLPLSANGKTAQIACLDEECPPKGPSFDKNLAIQKQTRRRLQRRDKRRQKVDNKQDFVAALKKRQEVHADRLVVSKIKQHSAIEVCNSQSSLGPDFLSMSEMMFCDMSEKTLWPVCVDETASYCFNMDTQTVKGSISSLPTTSQPLFTNVTDFNTHLAIPNKFYTSVNTWDALF